MLFILRIRFQTAACILLEKTLNREQLAAVVSVGRDSRKAAVDLSTPGQYQEEQLSHFSHNHGKVEEFSGSN